MRTLDDWLEQYGRTHKHPSNQAIHMVCVPLIFLSLVALLTRVVFFEVAGFGEVTAAWVLIAAACVFYVRLSWFYALLIVGAAVAASAASQVAFLRWGDGFTMLSGLIFVLSWIGQFVGHRIEGAKPAFFDDLLFLFVGPVWVFEEIRGRRGSV
jgi:uncharacterized membrane protein YGL010W